MEQSTVWITWKPILVVFYCLFNMPDYLLLVFLNNTCWYCLFNTINLLVCFANRHISCWFFDIFNTSWLYYRYFFSQYLLLILFTIYVKLMILFRKYQSVLFRQGRFGFGFVSQLKHSSTFEISYKDFNTCHYKTMTSLWWILKFKSLLCGNLVISLYSPRP